MARQRHLTKAPITEAVVDMRAALPNGFDVTALGKLPPEISERFTQSEALKTFSGSFEYDGKLQRVKSEAVDRGIIGHVFKTADATKVLQFRKDGFTFSKLKPYEDWAKLRDEAVDLWRVYVKLAKPESVSRVGLRYINHLNMPFSGDKFDFDDYLTAPPRIPEGLPQGIVSFFYRVVMPEPSIGATAVIHQALESIVNPKIVPVILDIDVFMQRDIEPDSDKIWEAFEQLHMLKNNVFFSYITEKTAELFA